MLRKIIFGFIISSTFLSCKPLEDQIGYKDEPYFFMRSEIPNALNLEAGKNGYYHFTLHRRDSLGLYEFIGELRKDSCNDCDEQISILFRASRPIEPGEDFNISDHIRAGNYDYVQNLSLTRHRKLGFTIDQSSSSNAKFLWDFGDGTFSTEQEPEHKFNQDADYNVVLQIDEGSCTSYTLKQIVVNPDSSADECETDFKYTFLSPTTIQFYTDTVNQPAQYVWDFGDGTNAFVANPIHNYSDTGKFKIFYLRTLPDLLCTRVVVKELVLGTQIPEPCQNSFRHHQVPLNSVDSMHLSQVIITYRNKNGEVFRSDPILQDGSFFKIENVETYENNELGDPVVTFELDFSCRLRSDNFEEINFGRHRGKIGVSYPRK